MNAERTFKTQWSFMSKPEPPPASSHLSAVTNQSFEVAVGKKLLLTAGAAYRVLSGRLKVYYRIQGTELEEIRLRVTNPDDILNPFAFFGAEIDSQSYAIAETPCVLEHLDTTALREEFHSLFDRNKPKKINIAALLKLLFSAGQQSAFEAGSVLGVLPHWIRVAQTKKMEEERLTPVPTRDPADIERLEILQQENASLKRKLSRALSHASELETLVASKDAQTKAVLNALHETLQADAQRKEKLLGDLNAFLSAVLDQDEAKYRKRLEQRFLVVEREFPYPNAPSIMVSPSVPPPPDSVSVPIDPFGGLEAVPDGEESVPKTPSVPLEIANASSVWDDAATPGANSDTDFDTSNLEEPPPSSNVSSDRSAILPGELKDALFPNAEEPTVKSQRFTPTAPSLRVSASGQFPPRSNATPPPARIDLDEDEFDEFGQPKRKTLVGVPPPSAGSVQPPGPSKLKSLLGPTGTLQGIPEAEIDSVRKAKALLQEKGIIPREELRLHPIPPPRDSRPQPPRAQPPRPPPPFPKK